MHRSVRLRAWQKEALDQLDRSSRGDFLTVATPGAGKTTFALTAAVRDLTATRGRRLVVVAPTQHLKVQWAAAAASFGVHLDHSWASRHGRLPPDMHGVVVTYQQVAANPGPLRSVANRCFAIFDEIHHAGEDRAWGDALRIAFDPAARRLSLSGTPFRSDTQAIPFVRYDDDEAEPDFSYGYGEALRDGGVVRPVFFPRVNGEMEWTAPDGTRHAHTFDDPLDATRSGQRLRTALSLDGEWLPDVLERAHCQLLEVRRSHPAAGGLVIAMDQEHARGIARILLARCGVEATVATSEDPDASARIQRFAEGTAPWIVAVRMVSEGVDIPRLRVGVYATNTTTELFFRQAVGRLVRWTRGVRGQRAYLFIPDDPRLRTWAVGIAEQRRHNLKRRERDEQEQPQAPVTAAGEEEQLSLFAAISAVATEAPAMPENEHFDDEAAESADDEDLTIALATPPLPDGEQVGEVTVPRRELKERLRAWNADRAKTLVQVTGRTHAQVNRELNQMAGVRRISEATVRQLETRLAHADRWLRRL
jgi:superfamily II DNA or RNA helicase